MPTLPLFDPNTFSISHRLGEPPICEFTATDANQTVSIAPPQAMTVAIGSTQVFSGIVDEVDIEIIQDSNTSPTGLPYRRWRIKALGAQEICNRVTCGKGEFVSTFSQPYAISDVANYLAGLVAPYGITANIAPQLTALLIDRFPLDDEPVGRALDRLAAYATSLSNSIVLWFVDALRVLQFYPLSVEPALPIIGITTGGYPVSSTHQRSARSTREQYANRIIGKFDKYLTPEKTESFSGDGNTTTFSLSAVCAGAPNITKNGSSQNVGVDGLDNVDASGNSVSNSSFDWYFNTGSREIRQDSGASPMAPGDTLTVVYLAQDLRILVAQNVPQINAVGLYNAFIGVGDVANSARGQSIVAWELSRRSALSTVYHATVEAPAGTFSVGLQLPIQIPGLPSAYGLCRSMRMYDQDIKILWTELEAVAGPIVFTGAEWFRRLAG